jgi:hypothetical protein
LFTLSISQGLIREKSSLECEYFLPLIFNASLAPNGIYDTSLCKGYRTLNGANAKPSLI